MGDVYWLSGDHDAAIKEGETILQLNPNYPFGYGLLGSVYACSGSACYRQAVEYLEHAIRLSPNDPWLQFYFSFRGLAEFLNQDYDAAIDWFQRSIQRNSNSAAPHCRLAAALALKGEAQKAEAALGKALQIDPNLSISVLRQLVGHIYPFPGPKPVKLWVSIREKVSKTCKTDSRWHSSQALTSPL
jgi:tetratricopeptide (TPR) repeat protein